MTIRSATASPRSCSSTKAVRSPSSRPRESATPTRTRSSARASPAPSSTPRTESATLSGPAPARCRRRAARRRCSRGRSCRSRSTPTRSSRPCRDLQPARRSGPEGPVPGGRPRDRGARDREGRQPIEIKASARRRGHRRGDRQPRRAPRPPGPQAAEPRPPTASRVPERCHQGPLRRRERPRRRQGSFKFTEGALAASLAIPADTPAGDYAVVIFFEGDATAPAMAGSRKIKVE